MYGGDGEGVSWGGGEGHFFLFYFFVLLLFSHPFFGLKGIEGLGCSVSWAVEEAAWWGWRWEVEEGVMDVLVGCWGIKLGEI